MLCGTATCKKYWESGKIDGLKHWESGKIDGPKYWKSGKNLDFEPLFRTK